MMIDPYEITAEGRPAPRTLRRRLSWLGPGLIISASIVGSGELIATTTLGAQVGFVALWIVLFSCLVKVIIQAELARYTISTGKSSLQALAEVPGPRFHASWALWCWVIMAAVVILQIGGIVGAAAQALALLFPFLSDYIWVFVIAGTTALFLVGGRYQLVEKASAVMVVTFTAATVICAISLQWTPYRVLWPQFVTGLTFDLPVGGFATAVAVFGITGVGASELISYPYWCIEKGYARFVGRADDTTEWADRARGWIRVMQLDVTLSMIVYTLATIAFFVLGASILFQHGTIPRGFDLVNSISLIYTETLGPWAFQLFAVGAFVVLYSTYFTSIAILSRLITDAARILQGRESQPQGERVKWTQRMVVSLSCVAPLIYFFFAAPLVLVIIGGIVQAMMLPILGAVALHLRYKRVDKRIAPSTASDVLLWSSVGIIFALTLATVVYQFS